MKIAIIGAGNVGGALGRGWAKAGHTIIFGVRDPAGGKTKPPLAEIGGAASSVLVPDAVRSAEVVVLATPWDAVPSVVNAMGDVRGKIIIDCTNPLLLNAEGSLSLSLGSTTSGAEELARYFLICMSFIGASYVTREGGQIRMEEFQVLIPPTPRWLLQMAIELAAAGIFVVFFVASVVTILNNLRNQTPTLEMPFWLFMAPLAVGSLLLIVETMMMFIHTLRRGRPEAKQTILT